MGCGSSVPAVEAQAAPAAPPAKDASSSTQQSSAWQLAEVLKNVSDPRAEVRAEAREHFNGWTSSEKKFADFLAKEGNDRVLSVFVSTIKRDGTDHAVRLKLLALISSHAGAFSPHFDSAITSSLVSGVLNYPTQYPEDVYVFGADILYALLKGATSTAGLKSLKGWLANAEVWAAVRHTLRSAQGRPKACTAALNLAAALIEGDAEQMKAGLVRSGAASAALELLANCVAVSGQAAVGRPGEEEGTARAELLVASPAPSVLHLLHTAVACTPEAVPLLAKAGSLTPIVDVVRTGCARGSLPDVSADAVMAAGTLLLAFARGRAANVAEALPQASKAIENARAVDRERVRADLVASGAPAACLALLQVHGESSRAAGAQQLAAAILEALTVDDAPSTSSTLDLDAAHPVDETWLAPALPGAPAPPALPANGRLPGLRALLDPSGGMAGSGRGVAGAVWHSLLSSAAADVHSGLRAEQALSAAALLSRASASRDGLRRLVASLHSARHGLGQGPENFDAVLTRLYLSCEPSGPDGLSPTAMTPVRRRLGPLLWLLASERSRYTAERWARRRALWRRFMARLEQESSSEKRRASSAAEPYDSDEEDEEGNTGSGSSRRGRGGSRTAGVPQPSAAAPPTSPSKGRAGAGGAVPPHLRYNWAASGAWDRYFTVSGLPYYQHRATGAVQWAEPSGEQPDATGEDGTFTPAAGDLHFQPPVEDDMEGLVIFETLWKAGYFRARGAAAGQAEAGTHASHGASGRLFGLRANDELDRSWRADDLVLRMCMCAIACEALCDAQYLHPAGEVVKATSSSFSSSAGRPGSGLDRGASAMMDPLEADMASDEDHHWPAVSPAARPEVVADLLAFIRECTASLEAARRAGFSLGNVLHPSTGATVKPQAGQPSATARSTEGGGSSSGGGADGLDEGGMAPTPAGGDQPFPFLFTPEYLASLSRLARCEEHTEVVAFASWVIREAISSQDPAKASGASGATDWAEVEARLAATAPAGALVLSSPGRAGAGGGAFGTEGGRAGRGLSGNGLPGLGMPAQLDSLPPFGWPMHGLPAYPVVPGHSPILAAVASLQDLDASIAAIGSGSLGRTGTAAVMAALAAQRAQVLQTLMLQQKAVAAAAAAAAATPETSIKGPISQGLVFRSPLAKGRKEPERPPVAVLVNSIPAADLEFALTTAPAAGTAGSGGAGSGAGSGTTGLFMSLFSLSPGLSWMSKGAAAALLGEAPPQAGAAGAGGAASGAGAASSGHGASNGVASPQLLTGTLWQFPWVESVGPWAAKDALEACGAKVGLRTTHFRLKLLASTAGPAAPGGSATPSAGAAGAASPTKGAPQGQVGVLVRLFGSKPAAAAGSTATATGTGTTSSEGQEAGAGGASSSSLSPSASLATNTLELEKALAAADASSGTWALASTLVQQSLLAFTYLSDEPSAASALSAQAIATMAAKDTFLRLKNKSAAKRAMLAAAQAKAADGKKGEEAATAAGASGGAAAATATAAVVGSSGAAAIAAPGSA